MAADEFERIHVDVPLKSSDIQIAEIRQQFYRGMLRRFSAFLLAVTVIVGGSSLYNSVTLHQVRSSQVTNTKASSALSKHQVTVDLCLSTSIDKILTAIASGDQNPVDYAKARPKCSLK